MKVKELFIVRDCTDSETKDEIPTQRVERGKMKGEVKTLYQIYNVGGSSGPHRRHPNPRE